MSYTLFTLIGTLLNRKGLSKDPEGSAQDWIDSEGYAKCPYCGGNHGKKGGPLSIEYLKEVPHLCCTCGRNTNLSEEQEMKLKMRFKLPESWYIFESNETDEVERLKQQLWSKWLGEEGMCRCPKCHSYNTYEQWRGLSHWILSLQCQDCGHTSPSRDVPMI